MLEAMPVADDYRAMSAKGKWAAAGPMETHRRRSIFPEYVRHLPPKKRASLGCDGRVLRSKELQSAFVQRLRRG